MLAPVTLPLWLFLLIMAFAVITFGSHFLMPSVRWFFRRRMEKAVARLNERLTRPIEPFRLLRRYDLIQRLIYDPEVTRAIVDHAAETGLREDVVFQQARGYAREIVPGFSAFTYFNWGVRWARQLSNALYRVRLGYHAADAFAKIDPDATVIFVMNHRSNMDYVLVTHLAADRSALSYAVGEWARVWPLSRLIRSMGGYFIRRRSRDALYRRVLRRYVQMATEGGVTQAIFPEGGLSLDGQLAPPKLGLIDYITEGWTAGGRDVVFVPVALNYDRVLEDRVLVGAAKAGGRRFEARIGTVMKAVLKQIWLRARGRFHRFGYAAVSFGEPLSLEAHPETAKSPKALGRALLDRIADVVPVLPVPLVAYLLEQNSALDRAALEEAVSQTLARLSKAHVHLARNSSSYMADIGIKALLERGFVREEQGGYAIVEDERVMVEYYANSIRHLLE